MISLSELRESMGLNGEVEAVEHSVTHLSTPVLPRSFKEDTRCPRCRLVNLTEAERCVILPYQRSVCTGAYTCVACGGTAGHNQIFCETCHDKGYLLKFEKRWFDYACSACVYEARRRGVGSGVYKVAAPRATRLPVGTVGLPEASLMLRRLAKGL